MLWTGSDTKYAIPFGPFLALGAVAFIFCGDPLIAWYLGLGSP
jgi:leader peptidase (prepilin peptidase)/N-methyltransferase